VQSTRDVTASGATKTKRSTGDVYADGARSLSPVEMIHGDCRDVMPVLPAGVFDACVCDPPYGLNMADWDGQVPGPEVWVEVLRLLKPGAALVAFAARRLYHELASTVQAAGFSVVDQGVWIYRTGKAPSTNHLRPAHEPILIARAPGRSVPVNVDEGRIPWRDDADMAQVQRIDSLRANGKRRPVYQPSLDACGRQSFQPAANGRWPTTVMATDDVLGDAGHVFMVPKVRNVHGHVCSKPVELMAQIIRLFVPAGGVVVDPFAGAGPVGEAAQATGRRAVLIERARAA
jgi:site-specific DNA-methyltransferase (adenine-specific)